MKKLLLIFFLTPTLIFAQDLLLFENGEEKKVTIIEITPIEVKYKMEGNIIYTVYKKDLVGVVLENGTFEKFDNKKSKQLTKLDGGKNILNIDLFQPFLGNIEIGYELFNESGTKSIKIPLAVRLFEPNINWDLGSTGFVREGSFFTGFERRYYPRGSDDVVKGFIGWGHDWGLLFVEGCFYYSPYSSICLYDTRTYYFGEALFVGGMLVQASDLINFSLNGKVGAGLMNFDDTYFSIRLNLSLGFRF